MKLLVKIAFDGTDYCGWQSQKNGNSIQEKINEAAERLFGFPCNVTGCSRTDSGVHARAYCADIAERGKASLVTAIPRERVPRALNTFLPEDISAISAESVPDEFHARYDVKIKEYEYLIYNRAERDPFFTGKSWHIQREITDEGFENMRQAAECFVGKKDFSSFMAHGSSVTDAVRCVQYAAVARSGSVISFRVAADGFLYNMVRIMTGTLFSVAEGKIAPQEIPALIERRDRSAAGMTAPACGLYLNKVIYNNPN